MENLYYKGKNFQISKKNLMNQKFFEKMFDKEFLSKHLNEKDIDELKQYLPINNDSDNFKDPKTFLTNFKEINNTTLKKFFTPLETFQQMIQNDFYDKNYQDLLKKMHYISLEEYKLITEKTLRHVQNNYYTYSKILSNNYDADEIQSFETNFQSNNGIVDKLSEFASSGYTSEFSDEDKEELFAENHSYVCSSGEKGRDGDELPLINSERFINLKVMKNQLTIRDRTEEEMAEFRRQEEERYKVPHLPWIYNNFDGTGSTVAPVTKKPPTNAASKPREHILLKQERPSYVTILCLVRDAAARLPDGVGTRADICDLLKDSQYVNDRLTDSQVKKMN